MKNLQHLIAAGFLSLGTANCVLIPSVENQLRTAYGCIGIGYVSPEVAAQNPSLARTIAENRAKADYQKNCLRDNIGTQAVISVSYDHNTNTAYAFQRKDKDSKIKF